jgi:hypothetical protein
MQNFATYQTSANFALLGLKNSGAGRTSTEYERLDASLEALATYKKGDEDNVFANRNTFFLVPIWDSDTLVGAITSKMRDGELSPVMYGDRGWVRALEAIRVTKDGLPLGANKAVVVLECKFFGELDSTDGELWVTPTSRCPELEQRVAATKPMQSRLRIEDVLTAMKARAAREVQAKKESAKPR